MPVPPKSRAWREIDLAALRHNVQVLRGQLGDDGDIMAVLKCDAYGHGAAAVARALYRSGVRHFAVASLGEAVSLRHRLIGGEVLILGYTPASAVPILRRWRITQAVVDTDHARELNSYGRKISVHVAIDTGMHRLGIPYCDPDSIDEVFRMRNLRGRGTFSHLCLSDSLQAEDVDYTRLQVDRFKAVLSHVRSEGYDPGLCHIQASYGLLNMPEEHWDPGAGRHGALRRL